jgi:hypothetical protein
MERLSHLSPAEIQEFLVHGFERRFAKQAYAEYCCISEETKARQGGK